MFEEWTEIVNLSMFYQNHLNKKYLMKQYCKGMWLTDVPIVQSLTQESIKI